MTDPCWEGYSARGTKEKDGKIVPNCVKDYQELSVPEGWRARGNVVGPSIKPEDNINGNQD